MEAQIKLQQLKEDFLSNLNILWNYFNRSSIKINRKNDKHPLVVLLTNFKFIYAIFMSALFLYQVIVEPGDLVRFVERIWTPIAFSLMLTRIANCVFHHEDIGELLNWFLQLYNPVMSPVFQKDINEVLEKQNIIVKYIMNILPKITEIPVIIYMVYPIVLRTKIFPSPLIIPGLSLSELSWPLYIFIYAAILYNTYNVSIVIIACDCFISLATTIFYFRFRTLEKIIKHLDYDGERDPENDRYIIKSCYLMQLDVIR